ncbi:selenocysteine lyase-like isoform X2 [Haliotis rubra]|uniref:selenocysteine lyase-like isoform X2 n=1 Tax=Haliotis rubra TaxID=36100 RepID=UPI001EE62129|nr:selenocysteine lyase-like isoform X2 [Haliotis rubra]
MRTHFVYLDYNATTPLDPDVLTAITDTLRDAWGNPSSSYTQGKKAKVIINESRQNMASMIGAKPSDIIFTSGGTEGNNWILDTAVKCFHDDQNAENHRKQLPHFITSNLEHDSVKLVLEHMVSAGIAECTVVAASKLSGRVEVEDVLRAVRPNTIMVTVMLANNETGVIQPVSKICSRVRSLKRHPGETPKILLHTDAAQAIGKVKVDVSDIPVDYLTIVGHKFYAPRVGAIYVRDLDKGTPLYPLLFGGGQERNFRPGTENAGMIAGLGKAAELVVRNLDAFEKHLKEVRDYLEEELVREFGDMIHINGKFKTSERLPNTCNFSFKGQGLEGHKVLNKAEHVQASVGAACHSQNRASPILLAIGIPEDIARNALRFSVGRETSKNDIDIAVRDLKKCHDELSKESN